MSLPADIVPAAARRPPRRLAAAGMDGQRLRSYNGPAGAQAGESSDDTHGHEGRPGGAGAQRPHRDDLAGRQDRAPRAVRRRRAEGRRARLPRRPPGRRLIRQPTAEKAFYGLLDLRDGSFDFDTETPVDDESCNLPTASLLMEGMRRIDEIQELRRQYPAPAVVGMRHRGAVTDDASEARVLGYIGPGARSVGDIVEGILVGGEFDEYDALKALGRLHERGIVMIEVPKGPDGEPLAQAGPPQPELER